MAGHSHQVRPARILLIDDDPQLCELVSAYLVEMRFDVAVRHTAEAGVAAACGEPWSLILLDMMLPDFDGIEALRRIRAACRTPVIVLTALSDETDRVVGLEMGADDYVSKTTPIRELLARIRAILRRLGTDAIAPADASLHSGDLRVDLYRRQVWRGDRTVELTSLEFDLLVALMRAKGRVKTRETLLAEVFERRYEIFDRAVDVHIASLRRKLADDVARPRFLRTVRGVGYQFSGV